MSEVTSEMIEAGVKACPGAHPDNCHAIYLAMKAAEPLAQEDELERAMFSELVKRGIDQDTADQVSQSVCAALVRSPVPLAKDEERHA